MHSENQASNTDTGRSYHKQCTGEALTTVKAHEQEEDITLFGSCFCPFVQRAWVGFEILGIKYKYYEIDPYTKPKPKELLEVSPKGLVPALRFNRYTPPRALNESTVILEFLEDLAATTTKKSILPPITHPYARALVRLQADFINRDLIPAFYRFLQAQTPEKQIEGGQAFHAAISGLVGLMERAEREILGGGGVQGEGELRELKKGLGVWVEGADDLGWGDVMAGPWLYRAKIVLSHYRGFELPKGEKFNGWLTRLFEHPRFKATCSTDQLYLDSYERYAFNRPNTSQVATAINEGKALP
ncbi:glutathione S-transferase [Crassisporium funariophilum]|nr:glutathione S-transferase [Crassisporium funariophilum]